MKSLKNFGYALVNLIFIALFVFIGPLFVLVSMIIEAPNAFLEGAVGNPIYSHRYKNFYVKFKSRPRNLNKKMESHEVPSI